MSHQPSDGAQSPPFTRETSPDDAMFEETSLAEAAATTLQSMKPPSPHSSEANTGRNSVERPHAPGMAPHVLPVTSKSSPASSSGISSKATRYGEPSQISRKTTSQRKKREYHLISREDDYDIKPYSFAKQPSPKKEIDDPSFKKAEKAARNIPAEIISIIDRSSVTHSDIDFVKDIKNRAAAAMPPKTTTKVKLGLRGDSGVGKSSVINSLLGVPYLAPQGDDGKACTSVVHEYHKPRVNQNNACEAEILFHTADTRLRILKEWVESASPHSCGQLGDDRVEKEDKDSETAIQGLFSLFCDHDECEDPGSIKKFVSTSKKEDHEGLILRLNTWMEELLNKFKIVSGKISINADTPQQLQAQTGQYTRHQKRRDTNGRLTPSPWPFVEVVRVYCDRPILPDDIILVDLPGTQDTNQFRVRTAMRYLNDVDFIGVVARSDRLQTDDNVRTYLRDAFRRKHRASTLLIATNSDSVDMSPTSLDEKIHAADPIHQWNLTALREKLNTVSEKHKQITRDLKRDYARQDKELLGTLLDQQSELESHKKLLEEKLFEYCVEMRNEDTFQSIRRDYSEWTKDQDPVPLPVFCVSNLVYAKCMSNNDQAPMMDINSTNIPALQAFLYALPASRRFKAFEHHHKHELPSLLNHLDLACSPTKINGHEELYKILLSSWETVAEDVRKSFKRFFHEAILPGIAIIKAKRANYAEGAKEKLRQWSHWHNQTFKTFCAHRGNWRTQKAGIRNWNEEMLELLVQDVERETSGWEDATRDLSKIISAKLDANISELIAGLRGADCSSTASMDLFVLMVQNKKDLLKEGCLTRVTKLQSDLITVKQRITDTQDMEDSYFVRSLEKTYDDCSRMSGSGSHARRTEALRSKISKKVHDPFSEMFDLANKDAEKVIQRHEKRLTQEVTKAFEDLNKAFLKGFKVEGTHTTQASQLRETLRAKIPHWREILTGTISRHLDICREYAKSG